MKNKLISLIISMGASVLMLSGCSTTSGYSDSDLSSAKMRKGCNQKHHAGKQCKCTNGCSSCKKTVYTAKDRCDQDYK